MGAVAERAEEHVLRDVSQPLSTVRVIALPGLVADDETDVGQRVVGGQDDAQPVRETVLLDGRRKRSVRALRVAREQESHDDHARRARAPAERSSPHDAFIRQTRGTPP